MQQTNKCTFIKYVLPYNIIYQHVLVTSVPFISVPHKNTNNILVQTHSCPFYYFLLCIRKMYFQIYI